MGESAAATPSQVSMSSSLANSLELFQRMFGCLHNDFLSSLLAQDDNDDGENSTICTHDDAPTSSYFHSILYPNFASWVVEPQDFRGKVMAPFDLPPDKFHNNEPVMMKAKKYPGTSTICIEREVCGITSSKDDADVVKIACVSNR
jgi:hypothetical protein